MKTKIEILKNNDIDVMKMRKENPGLLQKIIHSMADFAIEVAQILPENDDEL